MLKRWANILRHLLEYSMFHLSCIGAVPVQQVVVHDMVVQDMLTNGLGVTCTTPSAAAARGWHLPTTRTLLHVRYQSEIAERESVPIALNNHIY